MRSSPLQSLSTPARSTSVVEPVSSAASQTSEVGQVEWEPPDLSPDLYYSSDDDELGSSSEPPSLKDPPRNECYTLIKELSVGLPRLYFLSDTHDFVTFYRYEAVLWIRIKLDPHSELNWIRIQNFSGSGSKLVNTV